MLAQALAASCLVFAAATPSAFTADIEARWILQGMGSWNDPANWSTGVVPVDGAGQTFHAIVDVADGSAQANIDGAIQISELTLGDDLSALSAESLEVLERFHWSNGTLKGWEGQYHVLGEGLFDGGTLKGLADRCELFLYGDTRWTAGHLHFSGRGHVWIQPGAALIAETSGYVGDPGSTSDAEIHNSGTLRVMAPSGEVTIYSTVNNTGVVEVATGTLSFSSIGNGKLQGPGVIRTGSEGVLNLSGTSIWSGNPIQNDGRIILGGVADVASETHLPGLVRITGSLIGVGDATLENAEALGGGFSGEGRIVIPPAGTLRVGGVDSSLGRDLFNKGLWTLDGVPIGTRRDCTFENAPEGTVEVRSGLWLGSEGLLLNQGLFIKNDSHGPATIQVPFENHGEVRVSLGTLVLAGEISGDGDWRAVDAGRIEFSGYRELGEEFAWQGNGAIVVRGRTAMGGTIESDLALVVAQRLSLEGEAAREIRALTLVTNRETALTATTPVTVSEAFLWESGLLEGPAAVDVLGRSEINILPGWVAELHCPLLLQGNTDWVGGALPLVSENARLENSGELTLRGVCDISFPQGQWLNSGTFRCRENIIGLELVLGPGQANLRSRVKPVEVFLPPGESRYGFDGDVRFDVDEAVFSAGAEGVFSRLTLTNTTLTVERDAALEVAETACLQGVTLKLSDGTLSLPPNTRIQDTLIQAHGEIVGDLAGSEIRLVADHPSVGLHVDGNLTLAETDRLTMVLSESDAHLQAPEIRVQGKVHLGGTLHLQPEFSAADLLARRGPLVLITSGAGISGVFSNAPSGTWLTSTDNRFRFRLFYGSGSPYPQSQLVLDTFGSSYDLWRLEHFPPEWLDDFELTGPNGDANGDGVPNLLEFIFESRSLPEIDFDALPGQVLITVRTHNALGLPAVEWTASTDLETWSPLTVHRTIEDVDAVRYVFRYPWRPRQLFLRGFIDWP